VLQAFRNASSETFALNARALGPQRQVVNLPRPLPARRPALGPKGQRVSSVRLIYQPFADI
jgi:hypothetical protein